MSRAALAAQGRTIETGHLEFLHPDSTAHGGGGGLATLADAERVHIARVLEAVGWNKKEAARVLDISRGTLYRKIADYDLVPRTGTRIDTER